MTSTIAKVVRKTSHHSFSAAPREAFHPCHLCHPCGLFYFSQISRISQILFAPLYHLAQRMVKVNWLIG